MSETVKILLASGGLCSIVYIVRISILGRSEREFPVRRTERRAAARKQWDTSVAITIDPRAVAPARSFIMGDGTLWTVSEYAAGSAVAKDGGACLVFASPDVTRIVRCFPPDWRYLDADELFALSWNR